MYGPEVFYDEAANRMISEAYAKAYDECELELVSQPKIEITQLEKGKEFIFTAEVAVKPEVKLGEYKGLKVDKVSTRVTQIEVDEEIDKERERNARTIDVTDRAVQDKDQITLDFEGFVDGVAFEGGKASDYPLTIGYGAFIHCYADAGNRVVAGPVVFSLGMICIALFCTAATIIRQIIHTYNETTKYILPIVGYLAALITVISGICIFSNATSPSAFVAGHVITGVGFITACVATAATSSTRFSLIPENSKATGNEVPQGAFSVGQRRAMIILAIVISIIAWVWAFVLLGNSHSHPAYFVAGHVMVGLACICTSLIALVATIARQVRNDYSEKERNKWPKLVLLMGSISFVWGLFVILADSGSANGTTGYIMLGLGLVCYSISSKVILLAKIWRREFKLANRIPMIPVLTALTCLFLAAFVFELATVHADYFIPARVLVGLGAICFTLFSIVSILESGTSSK
mgnify:CR=1 FL=1